MHALLMIYFVSNRLFLMLQRFPVESKGRRKKLQEVFCESDCLDCGFFESTADVLLSLDWFLIYILVSVGWLCNHHMFRMFLNQMCNGESVGILSVASNTWYKSKTYLNISAHSKNKKKKLRLLFLFIYFICSTDVFQCIGQSSRPWCVEPSSPELCLLSGKVYLTIYFGTQLEMFFVT